jgi:hypothetical protein
VQVTLTHPISGFTGVITVRETVVLNFNSGTATADVPPDAFGAIVALGIIIGSGGSPTPYDANIDHAVGLAFQSSTSDTSVAARAAFAPPDAVVDAGGTGTHTTLQAAIDALNTAGKTGLIHVVTDLTITASIVLKRGVHIVFRNGATIHNNAAAGTDTFITSAPVGQNGQINNVYMDRPKIDRASGATGLAGKGFNMHGAYNWTIDRATVNNHTIGLYFDASPYPSGQCSGNLFRHPMITSCTTGIHFAAGDGSANCNVIHNPGLYGCTTYVYCGAGLGNVLEAAAITNLGPPSAGPLVVNDGGVLHMPNFHIEGNLANEAFQLNGGSIYGSGHAYFYNGGGTNGIAVIADAVKDMFLSLQGGPTYVRTSGTTGQSVVRARTDFAGNIGEWLAPTTDGGTPVLRAAVRSNGAWRLPPLAADPTFGDGASGDLWMLTAASGRTVARLRDGASLRSLVTWDMHPATIKLPDVTANTSQTLTKVRGVQTITSFSVIPNGFVAGTAGTDFWTVTLEEWNGTSKVATIGTITQGGQWDYGGASSSALSYVMTAGNQIRAVFAKTGAPGNIVAPSIQIISNPS